MRAFWAGLALAVFIAVGAGLAINAWPLSTETVYSTEYTRL